MKISQDAESYENMRNTVGLLNLLSLGEEDIRKGNTLEQAQVFQTIEKLLSRRGELSTE